MSEPTARLAVVVTPRAGRDAVDGWRGDELAVRVTVPPDEGRANTAVCGVVARALGTNKSAVSVERGATSRHKLLRIEGLTDAQVHAAVGRPAPSGG